MISFIQHMKYPGHQQNDCFFDTLSSLSRSRSFRDSIEHCSHCLHCRTFLTLHQISHDVALLLLGHLLRVLLHTIALLLGVIIALVPQLNLTLFDGQVLHLGLLYCATVLFLGIRTFLLVFSLTLLLIFGSTLFILNGTSLQLVLLFAMIEVLGPCTVLHSCLYCL